MRDIWRKNAYNSNNFGNQLLKLQTRSEPGNIPVGDVDAMMETCTREISLYIFDNVYG